jgi:uncharacterized protein
MLGVIVGPTRYLDPSSGETRFTLDLLDLDEVGLDDDGLSEPDRIPLSFFGHGLAVDPRAPNRAAIFEKRGPGAGYVDLREKAYLTSLHPKDGHAFYGHGAFAHDGSVLYAVEMNLTTREGVITVRDRDDFALRGEFPTYGAAPHDCHLINSGKTLAITNGGGPLGDPRMPSVTFVDVASEKLEERFEIDDPQINAGHIAVLPDRGLALVSAPRDGLPETTSLGGFSLRAPNQSLKRMKSPEQVTKRFLGESLSVAFHPGSGTVFATHPFGNVATLWSLERAAILAAIDLVSARGVTLTLDQRFFAVSAGATAGLLLFDADPFRLHTEFKPGRNRFGGSHIYAWARGRPSS